MPAGRPFQIDRDDLKAKMLEFLEGDDYKTITSFCRKFRISRSYLYALCAEDDELKDISEQINIAREEHLERGGLSGDLNAGMAKFALSQLGWSEKQEVKTESVNVNISKDDADNLI